MGDNSVGRARKAREATSYDEQLARVRLQARFLEALAAGADQAHLVQRAVGDELVRHRLLAPDVYLAASDGTRAVVEVQIEAAAPEPNPGSPDTPAAAARHLLEVLNATHRMTAAESQEVQALLRSAMIRAARIPEG